MAEARRVVLDTNTLLSALLFVDGRLVALRTAWQSGEVIPLLCAQTVEELLADYLPYGEAESSWKSKPEVPVCRDEKDLIFLDLAAVGAAHWLVTGDRDLLDLGGRVRFQNIAPVTAIELLTSAQS